MPHIDKLFTHASPDNLRATTRWTTAWEVIASLTGLQELFVDVLPGRGNLGYIGMLETQKGQETMVGDIMPALVWRIEFGVLVLPCLGFWKCWSGARGFKILQADMVHESNKLPGRRISQLDEATQLQPRSLPPEFLDFFRVGNRKQRQE